MKFSIDKELFAKALKTAAGVAKTNPVEPLRLIRIRAENDAVEVAATGGGESVALRFPVPVGEPGTEAIPIGTVEKMVAKLPKKTEDGDPSTLHVTPLPNDQRGIAATCENVSMKLYGTNPADFQEMKTFDDDAPFVAAPAADLAAAILAAIPAADFGGSRPVLTGVCFEFDGDVLLLVATDGKRLHKATVYQASHDGGAVGAGMIVPRSSANRIADLLASEGGAACGIKFHKGTAEFRVTAAGELRVRYDTTLVDGVYPNWRNVLPSQTGEPCVIGKAAFSAAVARIRTIAPEIPVRITPDGEGNLVLAAKSPDADIDELVKAYGVPHIVGVRFNSALLADALAALDGSGKKNVRLWFGEGGAPTILHEDNDVPTCEMAVMPLRD